MQMRERVASDSGHSEPLFVGDSEMARRMAGLDWSSTDLGPVSGWPESLKVAVRLILSSRYPMFIWWGAESLTYLYNDAYIPVLGTKHPAALGRCGSQVWSEVWDTLGPISDAVFSEGRANWSEELPLVMERNGFREETFFTFSYSPIVQAEGEVGGLFCACTEDTRRVVAERRLRTQRALSGEVAAALSVEEACEKTASHLASNREDIPFFLVFLLDEDGVVARLASSAGLEPTSRLAAPEIVLGAEDDVWSLQTVSRTRTTKIVSSVDRAFLGPVPRGSWDDPPCQALVTPLVRPGHGVLAGFAVFGLSPRRPCDDDYQGFCELVAGHVATGINNARAYDDECRRSRTLAELDRAKTAFFSNVSHEFRTPLTLMLGPLEDALAGKDEPLGPRTAERLGVAHRNGLRLLKLVNTLLDFSRIEAGRVQAAYEPVDLGAYTAELASGFRSAMERGGLGYEVDCASTSAAYVDREMWEKIVFNLLSNAFKFTLEGRVTVALHEEQEELVLTVSDTGSGIPAEELPHVFERFHRVEGAKGRTFEGTGIGLALVHELVRLHGGTISVESEPGRGARFSVRVRKGAAHLPADRISAPRTLPSTVLGAAPYVEEALQWLGEPTGERDPGTVAIDPHGERVLVADDNQDMRCYLERLLSGYWKVDAVADGAAALARVRECPPDLVLADVMMPRLDGFGLVRALRADERTQTLPVILLSARAGEEARVEGLEAGADDYLTKPFSARELVARVETHLTLQRVRRDAERRLRESEQRFRVMADAAPIVLWVTNPRGKVEFVNQAYCRFFGVTEEQVRTSGWQPFVHPEDAAYVRKFEEARELRAAFRAEARVRHADGSWRWIASVGAPRFSARGAYLGHAGSSTDITDQKAAESALRAADQRKDEFLAMLAHELRNPLAPIRTAAAVLAELGPPEPRLVRARAVIARQVEHMTRLVDDLLDVSRITQGKIELRKERVNVDEAVEVAVESVRPMLEAQQQTVSVRGGGDFEVMADRARLIQVVANLLSNAAKFSPEGGHITVRTNACPEGIAIGVRDEGIGLTREAQGRIFDLFVQEDTSRARSRGGLGIGLTLVRRLVDLHGGSVNVASDGPGRGAEFTVRFPAAAERSGEQVVEPAQPGHRETLRVLVVEDNIDAAESLQMLLQLDGHEVSIATDGCAGLRAFDDVDPDVALVDLGLPGMDGLALARSVRERLPERPMLIALSGYGRPEDKEMARGAGFDHHLTKPADLDAVRALLGAFRRRVVVPRVGEGSGAADRRRDSLSDG